jgi:hypothetical protein
MSLQRAQRVEGREIASISNPARGSLTGFGEFESHTLPQ